jgi:hypothetical protein
VLGLFGVTLNQVLLRRRLEPHQRGARGDPHRTDTDTGADHRGLRGQERITARKAVGMAIALAGVAVLKAFDPRRLAPALRGSAISSSSWPGCASRCSPCSARK